MPCVAIDAKIVAPFLHHRIPHHVGCPHVAIDVVFLVGACRPFHRVKLWQRNLHSAFLYGLHPLCGESLGIGDVGVCSILPCKACRSPILHVGRISATTMRAKDVVSLAVAVVNHRWVVNTHRSLHLVLIQVLCLCISKFRLCRNSCQCQH